MFKGVSYLLLSNDFQIVGCQFRFLNGSKTMRNLIRIALKWLFFSEISEKLPSSWDFAPRPRYVICFSYTSFLGTLPNCSTFQAKTSIFWLIKPPLTKFRLQSVTQPKLSLSFFSMSLGKLNSHMRAFKCGLNLICK